MSSSSRIPVPGAEPIKEESYRVVGGLKIIDRWFKVPLDYSHPEGELIRIFARSAVPNKNNDDGEAGGKLPICGPGFECAHPKSHPLTDFFIGKGFQMLYIDQRGTGLSTPVDADTLTKYRTVKGQADYLKMMRADNIVRDCEAIRKQLLGRKEKEEERKWTVHGQSFGGFCAFSKLIYIVFTTGGMPPLVNNPDQVYERTYQKLAERNQVYYKKYPQDIQAVQQIIAYLDRNNVTLPSGGKLTKERFLDLGLAFGGHGGIDNIHRIVQHAANDLELYDSLTLKLKQSIESQQSFDGNPIYALLHEACYCQGEASDWSASRTLPQSWTTSTPVLFTGEMIYPHMFSNYHELSKFRPVAEVLAKEKEWPPLYDVDQLKKNEVPVYTANFIDDMYVAWDLSMETVRTIKGARSYDTNVLHHNAVRVRTDGVMGELWRLRNGEVD
ncbi:proline iminopeptidase [Wilcoxina mikolae CBS 423.85]|nr:proline iminopeptidase [Wilcoxina mikolae CBS 423.85]